MPDLLPSEKRFRRGVRIAAALSFLGALLFSLWWFGPGPPQEIVLATGEPGGSYDTLGKEYQKRLGKMHLQMQLVESQGSMANLKLLLTPKKKGGADIALIQAGTYDLIDDEKDKLRGLIAVQWEPVWVFHRIKDLKTLSGLKRPSGKYRIAVGQKNSGTAALALDLLKANGVDETSAEIEYLSMQETRDRLLDGSDSEKIDLAFFVSSSRNDIILELLNHAGKQDPDVKLFSFDRHKAYTQKFPFLQHVILGAGVVDLEKEVPPRDVNMFATPTLLVCHKDLHPQTVEQILIAARRIHNKPELVTATHKFPTLEGIDLPTHETAEAYLSSGETFVTRMLPYWGVWLWFKVQILILPLLLVWLPFFRMFPLVYTFRINWLLRKHYSALQKLETAIEEADDSETVKRQIEELDQLRKNMESSSKKIPTHLQINIYQWRLHVSHVRAEAQDKLEKWKPKPRKPRKKHGPKYIPRRDND